MRPHEVVASIEPARWDSILAAVREDNPALWRDLERAAMEDQRIPARIWQRYSADDRRARVRRALVAPFNAPLALDAVRDYLLAVHRALVIRFLDLLEVPHNEGILPDGPLAEPDRARLDAAVDTLLAEYPRADVLLYLRTLASQDTTPWPALAERLAAEARSPASPADAAPGTSPRPTAPRADTENRPPGTGAPGPTATAAASPASPAGEAASETPAPPPRSPLPHDDPAHDVRGHAALLPETFGPMPPGDSSGGGAVAPTTWAPAPATLPTSGRPAPAATGLIAAPPARALASAPSTAVPASPAIPVPNGAPPASRPHDTGVPATDAGPANGAPAATNRKPRLVPTAPGRKSALAPDASGSAAGRVRPAAPDPSAPPLTDGAQPSAPRPMLRAVLPEDAPRSRGPRPSPGFCLAAGVGAEPPGLTPLDRLVIHTVTASLHGAHDAPAVPDLQAIVVEMTRLSASRPQSSYHLGRLAAWGVAPEGLNPCAGSVAQRAWYDCGRLAGWVEQQHWDAIARYYAEEPAAVQALLHGAAEIGPWAGAHLADALLATGQPALAAEVLGRCPGLATRSARGLLLDAASARLQADQPAEAQAILDALERLPPLVAASEPGDAALSAPSAPGGAAEWSAYAARLQRKQAECAQAQGFFGGARARLEAALVDAAGTERARLLADLGLVAGDFRSLAEVRLPAAEADPGPWLRRLEAGEACFEAAIAAVKAPPATAVFCLAALAWLREQPAVARPHFEAALQAMQRRRAVHRRAGVLAQAQFYLGACLLLELDTPARQRALDYLREALEAGLQASPGVWRRLLEVVALDPSLADPLFDLFAQQEAASSSGSPGTDARVFTTVALPPELVHDFVMRCAPRSDAARRRLAACARDALPAATCWTMLCRLLEAQRQAGDRDGALATLDALEEFSLAAAEDSRARLVRWRDFLADPANYQPEWSWEDALWSRVRTLELLGRDDDAFCLLHMPFDRLLADSTPEALAAAEDLLTHARQLALSAEAREYVADMTRRLRARQETARLEQEAGEDAIAARLRAGHTLRVLFVGGNETQAQYEAALRAALERRDEMTGARVVLEFRNPGYSSNWDKTLEAVRGFRNVDALVLMPFVRTQLGRGLRRWASEIGIPWVPCTGKGYDSLERAIRLALTLAAERKP